MIFVSVPGTTVQFCIWETRVQDFEAFVNATGYDATKDVFSLKDGGWVRNGHNWKDPGFEQGPTHPVTGVSWNDAKAFCAWLTKKERKEGLLRTNQAYRLQTDADWSCAVGLKGEAGKTPLEKYQVAKAEAVARFKEERKGASGASWTYPWGDHWPPPDGYGNFPEKHSLDNYPFTSPAGSFPANPAGLFDLTGNVAEWCEDLYDGTGSMGLCRGGSFASGSSQCFAPPVREPCDQQERWVSRGFRVVLTSFL